MGNIFRGACIVVYMITLMTMLSCSGSDLRSTRRYEGVKDDTLRVYIRENTVDDNPEQTPDQRRKQILELGKKRAVVLLIGHLRITYPELTNAGAVEKKIIEALEKGTIIALKCEDDWCESFIDFPLKDILNEAGKPAAGDDTK